MKKNSQILLDELLQTLPQTTEPVQSPRRPSRPRAKPPIKQMIRVRPDIETPVLLANARDNLASINCICERFAEELEGDLRHKALAIHQLTVLAEMLISRALETLDPNQPPASVEPAVIH